MVSVRGNGFVRRGEAWGRVKVGGAVLCGTVLVCPSAMMGYDMVTDGHGMVCSWPPPSNDQDNKKNDIPEPR